MSSRFVSGGTLPGDTTETATPAAAAPTQPQQPTPSSSTSANASASASASTKPPSSTPTPTPSSSSTTNNKNAAEWARVQAELEASRAQREATRRANAEGTSGEEKSLFEVLQANKAAKQAAFEEASRLSNQFRALDDDEVDFLEEVQAKERQEEVRKRRELEEGLGKFRQAQNKGKPPPANGGGKNDVVEEEEEVVPTEDLASEWAGGAGAAGRKRKREKEVLFKGLKRKSTSEGTQEKGTANKPADTNGATKTPQASSSSITSKPNQVIKPPAAAKPIAPKPMLGLVAYGSDDDDDD
ncbi:hypothetical protein PG985_002926 [Apiospora marii]|uniref:FAM192A/Fyv6 N-terminal domain-containing protein n=1 Tax=Apiospora marii TaxID=335849 RepID=A0ABR1RUI1_9PEZI